MHQLENGYTKIANTILEALFKISIPTNSMKILLLIIRQSYGFNKKTTDILSLHEICRRTNLGLGSAHCARAWLLKFGFVEKIKNGLYFINKSKFNGVQPTESLQGFSPLYERVQPTEWGVQPTERKVQPTEPHIRYLKENLKKSLIKKERKVFAPPNLEEVQFYCQERKNQVNPDKWFSHYQANGWLVGKNKMKDWRASVRYWEHSDYAEPKRQAGNMAAPVSGKYDGIGEKV